MNALDQELLAQYVSAFAVLDTLSGLEVHPELRCASDDPNWQNWQPRPWPTPPEALEAVYTAVREPGRYSRHFPPLYEALILAYRWQTVDLGDYDLLPNEPAEDLAPLLTALTADKLLYTTLRKHGYLQFGRGAGGSYDPVCFDTKRTRGHDCPVVRIDHERILCHSKIGRPTELAPTFRTLVKRATVLASRRTWTAP